MSDMDDDDLSKFAVDDDFIKPIDMGDRDKAGQESPVDPSSNPAPGGNPAPEPNPVPSIPDAGLPGGEMPGSNPAPEESNEPATPFLKEDEWDSNEPPVSPVGGGTALAEEMDDSNVVFINKGEFVDLMESDPTLRALRIGAGWDQKSLEEDPVDVDLSLFLLNKNDMTRIDGDFIFYNQDRACDGAIHHIMDSRTGAGEGDDENIFIDLNGVPFDILKIVFVFSVYDPEIKGHHFGMVKNMFFSIGNNIEGQEIVRYRLDPDDHKGGNGMIVTTLIREGPKWIMEASAEITNGGLAKIATDYGIIVKELQGTGEDSVGEEIVAAQPDKEHPDAVLDKPEGESGDAGGSMG